MNLTRSLLLLLITLCPAYGITGDKESVFCYGRLLHDVQTLDLFPRQRDFLELWAKRPQSVIIERYRVVRNNYKSNSTLLKQQLKIFILRNFENRSAASFRVPYDWTGVSVLSSKIDNANVKNFEQRLNRKWVAFAVEVTDDARANDSLHSFINVPRGYFSSAPGFELVYEESLSVVEALLAYGMTQSAQDVIVNLIYLVKTFGHVPPENREYFEDRAAPPLLPILLKKYYEATNDEKFVKLALPYAETDFHHWLRNRLQVIKSPFDSYLVVLDIAPPCSQPRPEHYKEDWERSPNGTTQKKWASTIGLLIWDEPPRDKGRVSVRLTSITEWSSRLLAELSSLFGNKSYVETYTRISVELVHTMKTLLYIRETEEWKDYDAEEGHVGKASFWPIHTGAVTSGNFSVPVLDSLDLVEFEEVTIAVSVYLKLGHRDKAEEMARTWLTKRCALSEINNLIEMTTAVHLINSFPTIECTDQLVLPFVHQNLRIVGSVTILMALLVIIIFSRRNK